jgi:hypothetical protein
MSTVLDASRTYRYRLDRHLHDYGNGGRLLMVMLNPSTADEAKDDPTIRRCIGFGFRFACTDLTVCNLYAYRATDPRALRQATDPIGSENEAHLRAAAAEADFIIAAWGGSHLGGIWPARAKAILSEAGTVHALRLTKGGDPGHPLYVPKDAPLIEWALKGSNNLEGGA